jgi:hypothetical protein
MLVPEFNANALKNRQTTTNQENKETLTKAYIALKYLKY